MYVSALESVGVETILGRFQEKQRTCRAHDGCGKTFTAHEEKMTDVNIAVSIVESCVADRFDIIYLVSGDNDLVPALEAVRRLSPQTKVTVVLPIGARAKRLTGICHSSGFSVVKIKEAALAAAQFPDAYEIAGKKFSRPQTWI